VTLQPEPTPSDIERLVAANAASNATMQRLVENVRMDADNRERKIELLERESRQIRRLLLLVGIAIALLFALALVNALSIQEARRNAARTAGIADSVASTNTLLLSCFDVASECAKLNAKAQKAQNDDLKAYQLTVAYCQAAGGDEDALLACVKKRYPTGPELPK
jgi:hypothetical protein